MRRREFARILGVHPVTVSKWIGGVGRPRPQTMRKIEDLTDGGVQPNDFRQMAAPTRQMEAA